LERVIERVIQQSCAAAERTVGSIELRERRWARTGNRPRVPPALWLFLNVTSKFAVQLIGIRNAFQFLRQLNHPNRLTLASDWATGAHLGFACLDVTRCADDFSTLASNDSHFHVGLLAVVDG
jgi:hypothetical protein